MNYLIRQEPCNSHGMSKSKLRYIMMVTHRTGTKTHYELLIFYFIIRYDHNLLRRTRMDQLSRARRTATRPTSVRCATGARRVGSSTISHGYASTASSSKRFDSYLTMLIHFLELAKNVTSRLLYQKGYTNPAKLAAADPAHIEELLRSSVPFQRYRFEFYVSVSILLLNLFHVA